MFGRWKSRAALAKADAGDLFEKIEAAIRDCVAKGEQPFSLDPFVGLNRVASEDYEACCERAHAVALGDLLPLAAAWAKGNDPLLRVAAADSLGGPRENEDGENDDSSKDRAAAVRILLPLLRDEDPRVVVAALEAIGVQQEEPAPKQVRDAVHACEKHPQEAVRQVYTTVANQLAQDSDEQAAILRRMMNDPSDHVRMTVSMMLNNLHADDDEEDLSPADLDLLVTQASDPSPMVQLQALDALTSRGDGRAVKPMLRLLEEIADGWATMHVPGQKKPGETPEALQKRIMRSAELMAVSQFVILNVAVMPRQCFVPALVKINETINDENVRDALAACRLAEPAADEPAVAAPVRTKPVADVPSSDKLNDPAVLRDYARTTRLLADAPIPVLLDAMVVAREKVPHALEMLQRECQRRREDDVIQAAAAWVASSDVRQRRAAAQALYREGGDEAPNAKALSLLLRLVADRQPDVVCTALAAVAACTSRRYDPALLAQLKRCEINESEDVRLAYLGIMQSPFVGHDTFDPALLDICVRLCVDPSAKVRRSAIGMIERFALEETNRAAVGRRDVRQALTQRLNDQERDVRCAAMSVMALLGDGIVMFAIERELKQLDADLPTLDRDQAHERFLLLTEAIQAMPSARLIPYLERWAPYADDGEHGDDWLADLIVTCETARRNKVMG